MADSRRYAHAGREAFDRPPRRRGHAHRITLATGFGGHADRNDPGRHFGGRGRSPGRNVTGSSSDIWLERKEPVAVRPRNHPTAAQDPWRSGSAEAQRPGGGPSRSSSAVLFGVAEPQRHSVDLLSRHAAQFGGHFHGAA